MILSTTVSMIFSAAHTDPMTGHLHGHDYEVLATFKSDGTRFEILKDRLSAALKKVDAATMHRLWSGENLAQYLLQGMDEACYVIEVNRPWLGHYVKAVR